MWGTEALVRALAEINSRDLSQRRQTIRSQSFSLPCERWVGISLGFASFGESCLHAGPGITQGVFIGPRLAGY